MAAQRLKEAAEKAKIELSQVQQSSINLPFITATADGPLHMELRPVPVQVPGTHRDLLERVKKPFEAAIKDAGLKTGDIDHVVMVGGSTRMPAVTELVESMTGKEANKIGQPR